VVGAGFTAIVFAVNCIGMIAFFDRALASGAIAFFIRHGTDSLGGGCLGLEGQALTSSVGAAAGCDLLILFGIGIGIGGISVAAGVAAGGFALTAIPFKVFSFWQP